MFYPHTIKGKTNLRLDLIALPQNLTPPSIAGDLGIGDLLTVTQGVWLGTGSFSYVYQWLRDGILIAGETGTTYTTVIADDGAEITAKEFATDDAGTQSAVSNGLNIGDITILPWFSYYTDNFVEHFNDITYAGNDTIFAATGDNSRSDVYKSTDLGQTWTNSTNLGSSSNMYSVEYVGNDTIIAGFNQSGVLYRSTDLGDNWTNIGTFHGMIQVDTFLDYNSNGIVFLCGRDFAAANNKILRSTDYGLTWSIVYATGAFTHVVSIVDLGGGVLLAGGKAGGLSSAYIIKSTDAGLSWAIEYRFLEIPAVGNAFEGVESFIHLGGDVVLCSMSGDNTYDQVWKSIDAGSSWTVVTITEINGSPVTPRASIANGTSQSVSTMAYDSTRDILYAGLGQDNNNAGRLVTSYDQGVSWTVQSIGGTTKRVGKIISTGGGRYIACTAGGSAGTPQIWTQVAF